MTGRKRRRRLVRIVRRISWAVAALAGLLAAGIAGLTVWLWLSQPVLDGRVAVAGAGAEIEILRDRWGIPHIHAESAEDAYFGLGFVHAQDRLFQMEAQRRVTQGRSAEVLGRLTLEFDRFLRVLGLYRAAERSVAALKPETRAALMAYADGVNAFMAGHRGALAPELALLLADRPEPWRPADSVAWLKAMGLALSGNWREETLRISLAERLGAELAASFFPAHPSDAPTILEEAERWPDGTPTRALIDLLPRPGNGSNSWVIAGRRTADGLPMLANDPHLGFSMPAVWYLAHLEAPGLSVAGATLPGVPAVIVGTNGHIAWGVSNAGPDTQDLFIERLDPADPGRYLTPEGSARFVTREETIGVRFGSDEVVAVRETRHGPVISDAQEDAALVSGEAEVVALAWTLLSGEDRTLDAGIGVHRAADWASFVDAARHFAGPQQNIVYADRQGTIGLVSPALIPVRAGGDGLVPARGWSGERDWVGFIPFEELPRLHNPASGMIVAANERPVGDDYPWLLGHSWEPGYRGGRIRALLRRHDDHDLASQRGVQSDVHSLFAADMLPFALEAQPRTQAGHELKARLAGWDGAMAAELVAPTVFYAWYRALTRALYADETGELFEDVWWFRPVFVKSALDGGEAAAWCDDRETEGVQEDCRDLAGAAFDEAAGFLERRFGPESEDWRWGAVHALKLRHRLFGLIPGLGRLTGVDLETGGDRFTVAAGAFGFADNERVFDNVHGPGLRAIIAPGRPDGARFVVLPGQSGNPFSPYWDNMTARWAADDPIPIALGAKLDQPEHRLVLAPRPR